MTEEFKKNVDWLQSSGAALICNIEDKLVIYKKDEIYFVFVWDEKAKEYLKPWDRIESFCWLVTEGNRCLRGLAVASIKIDSDGSSSNIKSEKN